MPARFSTKSPILLAILFFLSPLTLAAQDKTAAQLLPETTAAYAELKRPKHLLGVVLDHPLRPRVEALDVYQQAIGQKQYLQFRAVVAIVEARLGMKWRGALESLEGAAVAFDPQTQAAAALIKARDKETLNKFVEAFVSLAQDDARNKGNDDPIKSGEYRGIKVRQIDRAKFAVLGPWLLITDNPDLGKAILDRSLDESQKSLAQNKSFQQANQNTPAAAAWAYVNVEAVRTIAAAAKLSKDQKDLLNGRTDNFVIELIGGGLLTNLQKTPYATASISVSQQQAKLTLAAPHDPAWTPETREYFFGPQGKGAAPALLAVKETLLSLSSYRDVSQLWLRAGDLFSSKVSDQLAMAESNLSTLFSGKDFGEDILGAVKPQVQLVVARQQYEQGAPTPAIKLPSFALVTRLKEPEKMRRDFRRTFQSLIGFLNVVGAMNGQPQADLDQEKQGEAQLITATFAPEEEEKNSKEAKINFNFSPTVAFVKDLFVVSSTKQLARQLANAQPDKAAAPSKQTNTALQANLQPLGQVLEDNRAHLVSQNMLSDGNTKEEAEEQIGLLLTILGVFDTASLRLKNVDSQLKLQMEVNLAKNK